jgi:hypothetical protein
MMSHFDILAGLQRTKGCSSTAFRNPETRNAKSAQEPISATGTSKDKGFLFHCILKPRNAKCEKHPGAISATGTSKDKGFLFHCISKPRNTKCEKRPGAISTFQLPGLQRTWGLSLPLHRETETRNRKRTFG